MILGFAHPCLVVDDIERARAFYEQMFGFEVINREGWSDNPVIDDAIGCPGSATRGYMLAGHNCYLELFEFEAPAPNGPAPRELGPNEQGIRHISFFVDDCRAEYSRCLALGAEPLGTPASRESGVHAVYLRDPCGNIIELCEMPGGRENLTDLPGIAGLQEATEHV